MVRYMVTVMKQSRRWPIGLTDESLLWEEMYVAEEVGDCYFGYSYAENYVGKHFDLWLTPRKKEDFQNFVGFGKIFNIQPYDNGKLYSTQNGKYLVQEIKEDESTSSVLLGVREKVVVATSRRKNGTRPPAHHARFVRKGIQG